MIVSRTHTALFPVWVSGYLLLLVFVPRLRDFERSDSVVSAALERGYFAPDAFWAAFLWSIFIVGTSLLIALKQREPVHQPQVKETLGRLRARELTIVFVIFALAYFPAFPTRYGPIGESFGFILAMFRMACELWPYQDFELLYGPSLIYSLWGWSKVFGAGMASYFGFSALQEAVQFTVLMATLQIFVRDRRMRWLVFLLMTVFLLNTLLGVNWSALRRLAAVFAILLAASRPFEIRANIAVALVVGLHATYSHEYAAAALVGIGAIYGVSLIGQYREKALVSGSIVAGGAIFVWVLVSWLILGETFADYLASVSRVVGTMSKGHVAFEFYWTVNSFALFVLLALACVLVGVGLPRFQGEVTTGDRFMVGALVFSLVALKSGLNRADLFHLDAAFVALILAFLLRLPTKALSYSKSVANLALILVLVAAVTYLVGIYPSARSYAGAYFKGARDVLTGVSPQIGSDLVTRGPSTETERSFPRKEVLDLAGFLASPENVQRPVLYYGNNWYVEPMVGACSGDFKLDALMYSEFERPEKNFLMKNPDALVLMAVNDYERVFNDVSRKRGEPQGVEKLASWLSSVHYTQGSLEAELLNSARDRVTGAYLKSNYQYFARFGLNIVLTRNNLE